MGTATMIYMGVSAAYGAYSSNQSEKSAKNTANQKQQNAMLAANAIYPIQQKAVLQTYGNTVRGAIRQERIMAPAIESYANAMSGAASEAAGMQSEAYLAAGQASLQASQQAAYGVNAASEESIALQRKMYEEYKTQASPWATAGRRALDTLTERPDFEFKPEEFNFQSDPSYEWRKAQGIDAIDKSGAARGRSLSGAQDKALMEYGQNMASQEYQASFNRHWTEQTTKYNMASGVYNTNTNTLTGVAQMGLNAAQSIGAAGQRYANAAGSYKIGAAEYGGNALMRGTEAMGRGMVGSANALANGLMASTGYSAGGEMSLAQLKAGTQGAITDARTAQILGNANAETNFYNTAYGANATQIEETGAAEQKGIENRNNAVQNAVKSGVTLYGAGK